MLYLYSINSRTEEEIEAMKNCEYLKVFNPNVDDDYSTKYISKLNSIIINGKNIASDWKLTDFIKDCFEYQDDLKLKFGDSDLWFSNEHGIRALNDDLRDNESYYTEEIYNAENPLDRVWESIYEATLNSLDCCITELKIKYRLLKNAYDTNKEIYWN